VGGIFAPGAARILVYMGIELGACGQCCAYACVYTGCLLPG
jgi:hypothetical protein